MQKWEYLRIYHYPAGSKYQINGNDQPEWSGKRVDVILNSLGASGWELVSAVGNVNTERAGAMTTSYYFFLKRPKP